MIALKIIASGSLYLAVHVRTWQSKASTLTPVCSAVSPVWSGSGSHPPGLVVPVLEAPVLWLVLPPWPPPVPLSPPPHPSRERAITPSVAGTPPRRAVLRSVFIARG